MMEIDLDSIRKKYNIYDIYDLKKQIKIEMKRVHPDVNNGEENEEFYILKNELDYLNQVDDSTEIAFTNKNVEIQTMKNDINEILKRLEKKEEMEKSIDKLDNTRESFYENAEKAKIEIKRSEKIPKLTMGTITAISSFLWILPDKILENSIIKGIIGENIYILTIIWIFIVVFFIATLILYRKKESNYDELISILKDEKFQDQIFHRTFRCKYLVDKNSIKECIYDSIEERIYNNIRVRKLYYRLTSKFTHYRTLEQELIQKCAELIIEKALIKGIIKKKKTNSLCDHYVCCENLEEE